ncbi:MAG: hypothetical protein STHCBS139747_004651 [Sporothrix thermara]
MAVENKRKMPELMARLSDGAVYRTQLCAAPPKVPRKAREYPKIKVTVEKASALDAALEMANRQSEHDSAKDMARRRRIAILSVASQNTYTYNKILGGHWDEGSVATEEEDLCLRTTLPMSFCGLPKGSRGDDYSGFRLSRQEALYTRDVWVDHDIEMHRAKNIMRLVLRIAVAEKHRSLVLGTMSYCQETLGVSRQKQSESQAKNPAIWWREVLTEPEFSGQGLWREICFGVSDRWNDASYYEAFKKNLQGLGV